MTTAARPRRVTALDPWGLRLDDAVEVRLLAPGDPLTGVVVDATPRVLILARGSHPGRPGGDRVRIPWPAIAAIITTRTTTHPAL